MYWLGGRVPRDGSCGGCGGQGGGGGVSLVRMGKLGRFGTSWEEGGIWFGWLYVCMIG